MVANNDLRQNIVNDIRTVCTDTRRIRTFPDDVMNRILMDIASLGMQSLLDKLTKQYYGSKMPPESKYSFIIQTCISLMKRLGIESDITIKTSSEIESEISQFKVTSVSYSVKMTKAIAGDLLKQVESIATLDTNMIDTIKRIDYLVSQTKNLLSMIKTNYIYEIIKVQSGITEENIFEKLKCSNGMSYNQCVNHITSKLAQILTIILIHLR